MLSCPLAQIIRVGFDVRHRELGHDRPIEGQRCGKKLVGAPVVIVRIKYAFLDRDRHFIALEKVAVSANGHEVCRRHGQFGERRLRQEMIESPGAADAALWTDPESQAEDFLVRISLGPIA